MLYKLVVIFFAAAHGLPAAYKKHEKSAERLHALERTTGPKCCECKMSRQFKITSNVVEYTHCFEPAESIRDDGKKESCRETCKGYGKYTSKYHRICSDVILKFAPARGCSA